MASPEPLTPLDCNLQDFQFMPLDVLRLRDSELASNETPEACWAAVLLWCAAWHQVPAGSIPNDEQWIAKQAGYARRGRIDKEWNDVRPGALRGWVECSDGRLYHPVVAEKARDAWQSKLEQRWRSECGRVKKHNQRHGTKVVAPDFVTWLSLGCPQGQPLPVPGDSAQQEQGQVGNVPSPGGTSPQDNPGDKGSKGQGEGQGQGDSYVEPSGSTLRGDSPPPSVDAGRLPRALGIRELIAEGVERQHAEDWLKVRRAKGAPLTSTAWDAVKREAAAAGITPPEAVRISAENAWQGFKASWLERARQRDGPSQSARGKSASQQRADWLSELDDELRGKPREIDMGVIDASGQR